MFTVRVKERGGEERQLSFDNVEVSIGRGKANDVVLPKGNVSKRHARIVHRGDKFFVVDLRSTNGTYFNARKITSPVIVTPQDKVIIGDFVLRIMTSGEGQEPEQVSPPPPMPQPAPGEETSTLSGPETEDAPPPVMDLEFEESVPTPPEPPVEPLSSIATPTIAVSPQVEDDAMPVFTPPEPPPEADGSEETQDFGQEEEPELDLPESSDELLVPVELDVEAPENEEELPVPVETTSPELQLPPEAMETISSDAAVAKLAWKAAELAASDDEVSEALAAGDRTALVDAYTRLAMEALETGTLPSTVNPREVADSLADLGLMELLLASNEVLEVTATDYDHIFVSSGIARQAWEPGFPERRAYDSEVHRILGRLGVDTAKPPAYVEGFLASGCKARVVLPPLSSSPICQITAAPEAPQTLETLTWATVLEEAEAEALRCVVESGRSVAVVGAPSSGRVALLNALAAVLSDEALIAVGEHKPGLRVEKPGAIHLQLEGDVENARPMLSRLERFGAEVVIVDEVNDRLMPGFVQAAHEAAPQNLITAVGRDLVRFVRRTTALVANDPAVGGIAVATELLAEVFDVLVLMERSPQGGYRVSHIGQLEQMADGSLRVSELAKR